MTTLTKRMGEMAEEHSKDPFIGWARNTAFFSFSAGAKAALDLPEIKLLNSVLIEAYEDYIKYSDHSGVWDVEENTLIEHSSDCLRCRMENALDNFRSLTSKEGE